MRSTPSSASRKAAAWCAPGGKIVQSNVGTTEKEPRFIELIARGPAGHGSVPSRGNAVTKLSAAVGKVAEWTPPLRINETTGAYFKKLATMVPADVAKIYRDILNPGSEGLDGRPPTGCSRTSPCTGRWCTRRWCRRLSAAASATT